MPENFGKNLPMDPRMIREIESNQGMRNEQGSTFMQQWGGPDMYVQAANLSETQRQVYYAIVEGYVDPTEIAVVTGIPTKSINSAITSLSKKGLIQMEVTPTQEVQ